MTSIPIDRHASPYEIRTRKSTRNQTPPSPRPKNSGPSTKIVIFRPRSSALNRLEAGPGRFPKGRLALIQDKRS